MKENSPNKVKLHSQNRVIVQVYAACLVLFSLSPLFAFTFDVFTDKSGKFNLFQQNGYIWMATDGGVIRFNMATERAEEYTTAQGLSDNFCMRAIGDDAGNIWVSSRTGLDRFDGQAWHTCEGLPGSPNMPSVLLSNDAGKILYTYLQYDSTIFACFDGPDRLADSSISGAFVWNDGEKRRWEITRESVTRPYMAAPVIAVASGADTVSDALTNEYYFMMGNLFADANGRLWVPYNHLASSNPMPMGYSMFDGHAWRRVDKNSMDLFEPVRPIDTGVDRFKYRFIRIDGRIDTIDCSKWDEFSRVKDSVCIPPPMTVDTAGRLWIGTAKGLLCCDKNGAHEFDLRTGPLGTGALAEDGKGNIWINGGGISIFDGQSWTYPQKTNPGIAAYQIGKMTPSMSDPGGMWLTARYSNDENEKSAGNGIAYYNGRSWDEMTFYPISGGMASDAVLSMLVDSSNTVWYLCRGDSTHLCRFKNNLWTTIGVPDGLKGSIREMHIDKKDGIWLMANNPARFDGTNWKVFDVTLYDGHAGCNDVFEDSKGIMWFGTCSKGLYCYDGTDWTMFNINGASTLPIVTSIGEDATGALWVGLGCSWTGNGYVNCSGLWRQNGTGWDKLPAIDGLDFVETMSCDKSGAMWFACASGIMAGKSRIARFDGTQWQTFSMKDGFSDTRVTSILNAKNGDIWFSTYTGITRLRSGGLAERSKPSGKMKPSGRPSMSKIVVTSARCAGKTAPATFYDILGRRVNLQPRYQNEFRLPLVNGVYIAVHQKQVR